MLGVGIVRGKTGVHDFELPRPEIRQPDEVLVRLKEVGIDGTDYGVVKYNLQDFAEARDTLVLGHEGVGVVEAVGSAVKSLKPGDVAVVTARRGCGQCEPCAHNQSDMCLTGLFTERGLHKLDGLLTQYVVDREQYVVRVPPEARHLAVLTEPLSIVEKGVDELRLIQSRVPWFCPHGEHSWQSPNWGGCKVALVVGAGPLGLLATALIRLAGTTTFVADIVPEDHIKARAVAATGAHYVDARGKPPAEIVHFCCLPTGQLNIVFEASGPAEEAVALVPFMSRSSIYVMTGIPRGDLQMEVDAAELVRRIVRYNYVLVGSVNSNRRHFAMALNDLTRLNQEFGGLLEQLITRRVKLAEYQLAFAASDRQQIKTVVEIEPW